MPLLALQAGFAAEAPVTPVPTDEELVEIVVTATVSAARTRFGDKVASETLTESRSGVALESPNAQSVSDFIKDVSGVAVSKGANGSSTVSVRGIDQRMLRITIDGQRQGGSGNPLDSIPPEIVQSLEVTKTFTPDMEADAVGGTINVNTGGTVIRNASVQGRHQLVYNTVAPRPGSRQSLTVAQPFALSGADPTASVMATASYDDLYARRERLSNLREWTSQLSPGPLPYAGQSLPVLTLPVMESTLEHRQRSGLLVNADARLDDWALYVRSNLSRDEVRRDRSFNDTNPAAGTVQSLTPTAGLFSEVSLSRRAQAQRSTRDALNLSAGFKLTRGSRDLDATAAFGRTAEVEPRTIETGFLSTHRYQVGYDVSVNPYSPVFTAIDEADPADTASAGAPSQYRMDYLTLTRSELRDEDASLKANLRLNFDAGRGYLKFGGKLQQRRRTADIQRAAYGAGAQVLDMSDVVGQSLLSLDTLGYRFGPVPDPAAVAALLSTRGAAFLPNVTQSLINSGSGDTGITESLWALYGMGKWVFQRWTVLGGARLEDTRVASRGKQMQFDGSGQFTGFADAAGGNHYLEVLPGLHLRYEPQAGLLYRASVTRSMSRPASADLPPFRTLSFVDRRSRVGAPELKPYLATNFDLSVDRYDEAWGLVSAAVFYKKIDHFITDTQYAVTIGDLGRFIEFRRVNGEAARDMGAELSWQGPSWSLPGDLGRANVEANYNFNHGEAHHPTRPGETFPLPRQVDHQASLRLRDSRGPLSVDLSTSYRSGWWEDLIGPGLDNYINSAWDAELSGSYKIGANSRLTAGISNLLNRPTRHYSGIVSRMNDWQRNGVDLNVGVQWKLP